MSSPRRTPALVGIQFGDHRVQLFVRCEEDVLGVELQAYELQDAGIDTIEANHALGFKADFRDFSLAAASFTTFASRAFGC
jgi:GTP cyclohydrolase II